MINRQDLVIVEATQRGLECGVFEGARFSHDDESAVFQYQTLFKQHLSIEQNLEKEP